MNTLVTSIAITLSIFSSCNSHAKQASIAGGYKHTIFIDHNFSVYGMGRFSEGQLGTHATGEDSKSQLVPVFTGIQNAQSVSSSGFHSAVLTINGQVFVLGLDQQGMPQSTPFQVPLPAKVVDLSTTYTELFLLTEEGLTYRWDYNPQTLPTQIQGIPLIQQLASGDHYTLALTDYNEVFSWGINQYGQLGNGSTNTSLEPIKILENVDQITAANTHAMAIMLDGTVMSWGNGRQGRLGHGTQENKLTPTLIQNLVNITSIDGGKNQSIAIDINGKLFVWGWHNAIFSRSYNVSYYPAEMPLPNFITEIASGGSFTIIKTEMDTVLTWGGNINGQLGNGKQIETHVPTEINSNYEAVEFDIIKQSPCKNGKGFGDNNHCHSFLPKNLKPAQKKLKKQEV